jgi:hypothetical protein
MAELLVDDALSRARFALMESPVSVLRELTVVQSKGVLRISGEVSTFYHKQLAQEVVRSVADGMRVANLVHVKRPEED